MTELNEHFGKEAERLRRCMSDLLSLLALPAMWAEGGVRHIARVLLDVLPAMLNVEFLYLNLLGDTGHERMETAWFSDLLQGVEPHDIGMAFVRSFGAVMSVWPQTSNIGFDGVTFSLAKTEFGMNGQSGVLVAGACRSTFPIEAERLLLNVAGNQLALGVNKAQSLIKQKQYAAALDRRVALRTEELATANQVLADEIGERKKSEERLRRSEMLLAAGERISLTGTFSWRVDTDELLFSDQLRRIFEFDNDTIVTFDRIADRVHHDDLPLLAAKIEEVRRGGDISDYEIRLLGKDDGVKFLKVVARLIRRGDGGVECLGAVQDITERRRAQEARNAVRSELAHLTKVMSLGVLTASIAHEVNQPLSGIITNAGTCLKFLGSEPPDIAGAIETARRTIRDGNRAAEVISRLRALFKKKAAIIEPIDLNEAAQEVVALLWSDLQKARIRLILELANGLPRVAGDRVQLQQVIMNLMRNAMDAMDDVDERPRQLAVRTALDDDDNVQMSIQDSGEGFGAAKPEELFNAFYSTKHEGMGIGLSVSRSIIESHEGRIWAEANEGPGATLIFWLPQHLETSDSPPENMSSTH